MVEPLEKKIGDTEEETSTLKTQSIESVVKEGMRSDVGSGSAEAVTVDDALQRKALHMLLGDNEVNEQLLENTVRKALINAVASRTMPALVKLLHAGARVDPRLLCEEVKRGVMTEWVHRLSAACLKIDGYNDKGIPAMHIAASLGNKAMCLGLMTSGGASFLSTGPNGQKPLHLAAAGGHEALCSFFLDHGAGVRDTDKIGATALHYAAAHGHVTVVVLLCKRDRTAINAMTDSGTTALDLAVGRGFTEVVTVLVDVFEASSAAAARQSIAEEEAREAEKRRLELEERLKNA